MTRLGWMVLVLGVVGCAAQEREAGAPEATAETAPMEQMEGKARQESAEDMAMPAPMAPAMEAPGQPLAMKAKVAEPSTESYDRVVDNAFLSVADKPLSTFSVDVDTASYSNVRRFLSDEQLPPKDAVRIEEMVNYFSYDYPNPTGATPFSVTTEVSKAPWNPKHQVVHIGLQGKRIAQSEMPPRNLVFLVDVSGSMGDANKLPLLKESLVRLTATLTENDHIAIVVYAGASGLALPATSGANKQRIISALDRLESGGSTNGAEGIQLAYQVAQEHFVKGGVNRVLLATDGDFNVGKTSQGELVRLIEKKRESGVFLTVLGFGMGNYKDSTLEKLADAGNGNYAYIDNEREAHKVLVEEGGATLITIAKDVKIQVEFNPAEVAAYRLIGYENRMLQDRDFNDDKKDAGDIGAGHTVTALYEIVPHGVEIAGPQVDPLKYQRPAATVAKSGELMNVKLRYKDPDSRQSRLIEQALNRGATSSPSDSFRFSAAVAAYGMLLRESEHKGAANFDMVEQLASGAMERDPGGHRHEFLQLVKKTRRLQGT